METFGTELDKFGTGRATENIVFGVKEYSELKKHSEACDKTELFEIIVADKDARPGGPTADA